MLFSCSLLESPRPHPGAFFLLFDSKARCTRPNYSRRQLLAKAAIAEWRIAARSRGRAAILVVSESQHSHPCHRDRRHVGLRIQELIGLIPVNSTKRSKRRMQVRSLL